MNAVFERDFVAYSASARFQWLRFLVAAGMGGILLALVLRAYATQDFSSIGATVFVVSALFGMAIVLVVAPGAFATVLVHSRAGNTLPVLLTTPLSTFSIASGAFLARGSTFFALLLATWPPIASSLIFGGVRGSQLLAVTATIAATGLLVAGPAFVASAFARRTAEAVVAAYLFAVVSLAGLYLVGAWFASMGGDAAAVSPIHAVEASVEVGRKSTDAPYFLLAWCAALSAVAVVCVSMRLAREGRGVADAARIAAFSGRQCRTMRHENPVLDRETRSGGLLRGGAARGLFVSLLLTESAFIVLAATMHGWDYLPLHFGVLAMQIFLLVLAVTASGATALAAEREGRTLDLVRVTPLTPREIVIGKLCGLLRTFWLCLCVPIAHLVFGAALGVFSPFACVLTAATGALALSAWAVFALSQSLDQANPNRAVLRTMIAFAIVAVLLPLNIGIPINAQMRNTNEWVRYGVAFGANPVALTLLPAAALVIGGADATNTVAPVPTSGDMAVAAVGAACWSALYAWLGYGVYRRLFHMYKTRVDG